ncbi:NAD/NADP octopine/nopaline dehydrogenase family protein [Salipiger mucosus]|uniref:2-dehydropantoate 2-reductase n=1 Tax=Salipiger mucosus DSM 16094 TaxID=1123237 RepID=S9Q3F5_9RHOB|nr:NAD/NADP octopine/nopaline dehydrogenase family protein [Salipiger mucosus]EPX75871.1 hypothetical protein Salmuc_03158 [Salipiger mucosus DSM 16094]
MKIAIIGSGSIALGQAAQFREKGHEVSLYVRSAPETPETVALTATGAIDWQGAVTFSGSVAAAIGEARLVMLCLPANHHKALIDRVVDHLGPEQILLVSGHYPMTGIYLNRRLAERGENAARACCISGTMVTGRRRDARTVAVSSIRQSLRFATLPGLSGDEMNGIFDEIAGKTYMNVPFGEVVFGNMNAVAHVPMALCNLTRLETGEVWSNYGMMTPTVCRLIERVDEERCAVAAAYGITCTSLADHLHMSFGTSPGTVADMAAEIVRTRGGPNGPASLQSRYITEDIPFGILPMIALGARKGVDLTAHESLVSLFSILFPEGSLPENDMLGAVGDDVDLLLSGTAASV